MINTPYGEADLCVSPDERFLVITCWERPDNNGGSDLYVGFRKGNGTWSRSTKMGQAINSKHNESAPTLSPDGRYLFFVRVDVSGPVSNCATFWVDAKILDGYKPKNFE
jgi:hypothetical protein